MKVVVVCWMCGKKLSEKEIKGYDGKDNISHSLCDDCVDIAIGNVKKEKK